MLLQAYNYIRLSPKYVNTQLTESWMREYQVPIVSSGTHPHMMTNGNGGFVFHGTLVHDDNVIITKPPLKKKARNDRN
jgi:tRNA (adenine-N(1)-)-methyltransferase non-catalytic subunit